MLLGIQNNHTVDGTPIFVLESAHLVIEVAPGVGGRIIGIKNKVSNHQFLWRNERLPLRRAAPGSAYDPNFYGGIDEVIPNDSVETIDGIPLPDHGELWTSALDALIEDESLVLRGKLALCGLSYERRMGLRSDSPILGISWRISNPTDQPRHLMWKLHAALTIEPGDDIICPARTARVLDPAWSRWKTTEPFAWPNVEGRRADLVPPPDGTCDFLLLSDLERGEISWRRPSRNLRFTCAFDTRVFPVAVYFGSYGGLNGHYTAVLEPCTNPYATVGEAMQRGKCLTLAPGERMATSLHIYAGPDNG